MAFEKNNWKSGDVISSTKLNEMEDGIVEASEPVAWEDVTDKPETFTPETHSHDWTEITGKPDVTGLQTKLIFLEERLEGLEVLNELFDELESRISALETPEV